jgi:hypothetical protein
MQSPTPHNPSSRNRARSSKPSEEEAALSQGASEAQQQAASSLSASDEEIARRAYARWEGSGRDHGRDQEHWFAAEEELRGGSRRSQGSSGDTNPNSRDEQGNGM